MSARSSKPLPPVTPTSTPAPSAPSSPTALLPHWVGDTACMRHVLSQLSLIAPTFKPVLIHGETGTGKEWAARWLHCLSGRQPWVAVNCALLKPDLLDSLLFGHVRGAFSGAVSDHIGFFEKAHNGTLFLDEIGDLPLSAQASLLRVLQEDVIYRVGSSDPLHVQVRVLCATHHDLRAMVARGAFREDLFYRLSFLHVTMPALRERKRDIITIARRFLAQEGLPRVISRGAEALLIAHPWPGNVRELQTVIYSAALQTSTTIDRATLARSFAAPPSPLLARGPRAALECITSLGLASCAEVAQELRVSSATALRSLTQLIQAGLVRRQGTTRAAKYALTYPDAPSLDPPQHVRTSSAQTPLRL